MIILLQHFKLYFARLYGCFYTSNWGGSGPKVHSIYGSNYAV